MTTAVGEYALILDRAANTLAGSATWQSLTGFPNDVTAARGRVFEDEYPVRSADEKIVRPFCTMEIGDDVERIYLTQATSYLTGSVKAVFEIEVPEKFIDRDAESQVFTNWAGAKIDILNTMSAIESEMVTLAQNATVENGYLNITGINGPRLTPVDPRNADGARLYYFERMIEFQ